jgi:hypothetical protein
MLSYYDQLKDWARADDMRGFDCLGADQIITVPTAGANYTDVRTVTAVQAALVKRGYDLGKYGVNKDGIDGLFGSATKKAIQKLQKDAGLLVTGTINEDVIRALQVTPGVLPPGITLQGVAAVQASIALDAATKAERANTTGELQKAAQDSVNAANAAQPPLPPEVRKAAMDALEKSKKVTTPAQMQQVKQEVQQTALVVASKVAPSWWVLPAWQGGMARWKVAAIGGGGVAGLGVILGLLFGGPKAVK